MGNLYFDCLTVGPIARTVRELELFAEVLFTPNTEFGMNLPKYERKASRKTYRVGISSHFPFIETDNRIISKIREFSFRLEEWGLEVESLDFPKELFSQLRDGYSWFGNRFMAICETEIDAHQGHLESKREERRKVNEKLDKFLEPYDFWILPVSPTLPYLHNLTHSPIDINGKPVKYWKATIAYSSFLSYSGLPILTLPIGLVDNLPLGVQIVGKRWAEADLFAFGRLLEQKIGRLPHPPLSEEIPEVEDDGFLEEFDSGLFDL